MHKPTSTRSSGILLFLLASSFGCGPADSDLPPLEPQPPLSPFATRGVVPCAHPTKKSVAFDEPTASGVSAADAFAQRDGQCSAPLKWTSHGEETEVSVQVVLDRDSAVEVTYPVSDTCSNNKLMVDADITLSTSDGKLALSGRGTFTYIPASNEMVGPIELPAELELPVAAQQGLGLQSAAVVRIGAGGSTCAGEVREQALGSPVVGAWTKTGCPLGQSAIAADSSPELDVRMQQLAKAWHEAHLEAAWDSGDKTQLELDVKVNNAPICEDNRRVVNVPVDVRYGTSDGLVPAHDVLAHVDFSLLSHEPSVHLLLTEQTDCSAPPVPGYCESLSSANLRFEITYPNAPYQRLARLLVNGQLRGSSQMAATQRVLTAAGTPHAVECLLTTDCAVDEVCSDGFCRLPARGRSCVFDSDCGASWHCRAGACNAS